MVQTSKMLSAMSNCAGFVMTPKLDKNIFHSMELVPLGSGRVLAVMLTRSGMSKHFVIQAPHFSATARENLRLISLRINRQCQNQTLQQVQNFLKREIKNIEDDARDMLSVVQELEEEISRLSANRIYWEGASNILALPDISEQNNLYNLFRMMESKQTLNELLEQEARDIGEGEGAGGGGNSRAKKIAHRPRVRVQIGSENTVKELQNLSVVSSTYKMNEHTVGVLGILGPKRMEYQKMISLVDYVSQIVNRCLRDFEEI